MKLSTNKILWESIATKKLNQSCYSILGCLLVLSEECPPSSDDLPGPPPAELPFLEDGRTDFPKS